MLAPGQDVECHVKVIGENYIIVDPISEPKKTVVIHYSKEHFPEVKVDYIMEDLEKLIKSVSGNAEVMPNALLHIIRLQQLTIKMLKSEY